MNNLIVLIGGILFLLSALLLIAYFVRLFLFERVKEKANRKSRKNCFAFERYSSQPRAEKRFSISVLLLSYLCFLSGIILFFYDHCTSGYRITIGIALTISSTCLLLTNLRNLRSPWRRRILSFLGFVSFDYASLAFAFLRLREGSVYQYELNAVPVASSAIFGIFALLGIACFFNPKFFSWFKRNKSEENGMVIYEKQKWNFYAFYEWCFLIALGLSSILLSASCFLSLK